MGRAVIRVDKNRLPAIVAGAAVVVEVVEVVVGVVDAVGDKKAGAYV